MKDQKCDPLEPEGPSNKAPIETIKRRLKSAGLLSRTASAIACPASCPAAVQDRFGRINKSANTTKNQRPGQNVCIISNL